MISVIVPIYRCEIYLDKLVQSVLSQTYSDFEVILIDDGSTDGTVESAREYEKKDPRIHVIVQDHAGVSAARNRALKLVQGEYILFIDGDDYIESELFEKLISAYKNNGPGCVTYMMRYRNGKSGEIYRESHIPCDKRYVLNTGDDVISHILRKEGPCYSVWGHMFRADIIEKNQLKFQETMFLGEDSLFFWEYLMCCNDVMLIDYVGYNYVIHDGSLTKRERDPWKDDIPQRLLLCENLNNFILANKKHQFNTFAAYIAWATLNQICKTWESTGNTENLKACLKTKTVKDCIYPLILKYASLRRKILTLIFRTSPHLFRYCLKIFS